MIRFGLCCRFKDQPITFRRTTARYLSTLPPRNNWNSSDIRKHHEYIDVNDIPESWFSMDITIDVEAKAKELAVLKLMKELNLVQPI